MCSSAILLPNHRFGVEIELLPCGKNMRYSGLTDIPAIPGGPAGPRSPCWDLKKIIIYNDINKIFTYKINAQIIIWIW